ncbi:hypothetical protein ACFL0O_02160 [Thermodesulfobacteriota bacterium]
MIKKRIEIILVCVLLLVVHACASGRANNFGRISPSLAATRMFESHTVLPDHHYYYSGPDGKPNAIIGIDQRYTLSSKLWKPVNLTSEKLRTWINFILDSQPFVPLNHYGSFIIDPDGQQVGVWYSPWMPSTAKMEGDNRIVVQTPYIGDGRSRHSGWGTDDYL